MYDIVGIIVLLLDIWAIVNIVRSNEETLGKIIWVIVILALPVLGLLIWFLLGPGKKRLPNDNAL